ncbi:hypothetical protein M569_14919, partial [Genlisea aurea]
KKEDEENWHISTWSHRAWFAVGCAAVLFAGLKSVRLASAANAAGETTAWLKAGVSAVMGYLTADLSSGIYHWAIDNYGGAGTPFFGSQIEAFQSHHQQPWAITRRQLANNLHIAAAAVAALILPFDVFSDDPSLLAFVAVYSGCVMFSQQFHAWAHTPRGKLPAAVAALQNAGILVARAPHATHHRPPYNSNYCIVSGIWNRFLDESKFFYAAEFAVAKFTGAQPRSWGETTADWLQVAKEPED